MNPNKLSYNQIGEVITDWHRQGGRSGTTQRLGQYLINAFRGSIIFGSYPEIFYEENNSIAVNKFIAKFGA